MDLLKIKKWNGEHTYDLPENTTMFRCATEDNRNLVFPPDEEIVNFFKSELGLDGVSVMRRYDTCLILAVPTDRSVDKTDTRSFLKKFSELVLAYSKKEKR